MNDSDNFGAALVGGILAVVVWAAIALFIKGIL